MGIEWSSFQRNSHLRWAENAQLQFNNLFCGSNGYTYFEQMCISITANWNLEKIIGVQNLQHWNIVTTTENESFRIVDLFLIELGII